jgi:nudix-type nucleoside diphosphatase (YffH/AdpP family)
MRSKRQILITKSIQILIMLNLIKEKTLLDDKLIIQEGKISNGEKEFSKLRVKREDASAVLIYNQDSKTIILTKQFRYPISSKTNENILEIVAGKIDKDEKPLEAAIREVKEETGYHIRKENIHFQLSCFSTPGYSSECFFIYYAIVNNVDKLNKGGGNKEENEEIEIHELKVEEFKDLIRDRKIKDAKTYLAGLLFMTSIQNEIKGL